LVCPTLLEEVTQGALRIETERGVIECPLEHTEVEAAISGFLTRVRVTQTFYNSLDEKIEAVYVFPLPHKAAVDEMIMVVGERRIVGIIC
jgi:Ca-activated chloride channel family protein